VFHILSTISLNRIRAREAERLCFCRILRSREVSGLDLLFLITRDDLIALSEEVAVLMAEIMDTSFGEIVPSDDVVDLLNGSGENTWYSESADDESPSFGEKATFRR